MSNIEAIAKEAKVSIATVSRTLRNPKHLKTAKQRRVIDVAKQHNYDFGMQSEELHSQKLKQILLLSFSRSLSPETFYANDTYLPIVNGINSIIEKYNYSLVVKDIGVDEKPPPELLQQSVDGIIFHGLMSHTFFNKYIAPFPHVGIQRYDPLLDSNWVFCDFWKMHFMAVQHLYSLGHRQIGFISDFDNYVRDENYRGYCDGMKSFGLEINEKYICRWERQRVNGILPSHLNHQLPDYRTQLSNVMEQTNQPTAFVCCGYINAICSKIALEKMGYSIPQDISIFSSCVMGNNHGITAANDNLSAVCARASELLLELINQRTFARDQIKILVQPDLVQGETTAIVKKH